LDKLLSKRQNSRIKNKNAIHERKVQKKQRAHEKNVFRGHKCSLVNKL